MGILSGIVSFFLGLTTNGLDYLTQIMYEPFGYSLVTFEKYFPAAAPFRTMFIYLGYGFLFLIFLFQLLRGLGLPLGIQAEDPIKLTMKVGLFWGLIWRSSSLMDYILSLFTTPLNIFTDTALPFNTQSVMDLVINIISGAATVGVGIIINIILTLILAWQFVKLLLEVIERYIVLCFVIYTAPLALAVGPFESTAQVFKSWCRLFVSQMLLILMNVWSIRLFNSFFAQGLNSYTGPDFIVAFLIGLAFLKFAQKIDTTLRIIGLNTASTGAALGSSISGMFATTMAASRLAGRFGKGFGKGESGNGASSNKSRAGAGDNVRMSSDGAERTSSSGAGQTQSSSGLTPAQKNVVTAAQSSYQQSAQAHSAYAPSAAMVKNNSDVLNSRDALLRGNDANAVAGSMFQPAEGFEQTPAKMDNGNDGFLYTNPSTGEGYAVSFDTAGNGVVTGEMGSYDMQTGGISDMQPITMASEQTASELGIKMDGETAVLGRDGNGYVPVENIHAGAAPFKMAPQSSAQSSPAASGHGTSAAAVSSGSVAPGMDNRVPRTETMPGSPPPSASSVVPPAGMQMQEANVPAGGESQATGEYMGGQPIAGNVVGMSSQTASAQNNVTAQTSTSVSQSVQSTQSVQSSQISQSAPSVSAAAGVQSASKSESATVGKNAEQFKPNADAGAQKMTEQPMMGHAARVEPTQPPIPHNMEGKAENIKRPDVTEPDQAKLDGIETPETPQKLSFSEKASNLLQRFKDIFR